MNRHVWIIVVLAGALGLGAGIGVNHWRERAADERRAASIDTAAATAPEVTGTRRPALRLPGLDGTTRSLAEFDGQVILLNFWATWCPPCLREIPALMEVQSELGDAGFQVVGLALDGMQATNEFVAEHDVNYPVLVSSDDGFAVSRAFGNVPSTLPYSVVIDREGIIRAIHRGALTREQATEMVRPLL